MRKYTSIEGKRICIVRKDIGDEDRGGIAYYYKSLIGYLVKAGCLITVITQIPYTREGVKVIQVPKEDDVNQHADNVAHVLEGLNFDLIDTSSYKFELLHFLRQKRDKDKCPVVVRCEPSSKTCLFNSRELEEGEKEQLQLADYIVGVSQFAAQDINRQYGQRVDDIIYLGIDYERLDLPKQNQLTSGYYLNNSTKKICEGNGVAIERIISSNLPIIFWCGKPTPMKGYDYLEKIIDAGKEKFFFIVNCTPIPKNQGVKWVKETKSNILRIWGINKSDQINLWRYCNATLLTSRVEGFSLVVPESLYLGKPLMVNNQCTTIREFPVQQYINYVNCKNPKDVIDALSVMVKRQKSVALSLHEQWFFSSKRFALDTIHYYEKIFAEQMWKTNRQPESFISGDGVAWFRRWVFTKIIKKEHSKIPVRQVYCILLSNDDKVAIVSKDGIHWQLPGGKPKIGENNLSTLKREVHEEIGLKLKFPDTFSKPRLIGYYIINTIEGDRFSLPLRTDLQLRYMFKLGKDSDEYSLKPHENLTDKDPIHFTKWINFRDLSTYLPWYQDSVEYTSILNCFNDYFTK